MGGNAHVSIDIGNMFSGTQEILRILKELQLSQNTTIPKDRVGHTCHLCRLIRLIFLGPESRLRFEAGLFAGSACEPRALGFRYRRSPWVVGASS